MPNFQGQFNIRGLYPSTVEKVGVWMRDRGRIQFLFDEPVNEISLCGETVPFGKKFHSSLCERPLSLDVCLDGKAVSTVSLPPAGVFEQQINIPVVQDKNSVALSVIEIRLRGVGMTNFLALMGRLLKKQIWLPKSFREWLQPFRRQNNNRQVLVQQIRINGELLVDLEQAHRAFESDFILKHAKVGVNVVGWFHGFLGVGESARACARASRAIGFETDPVPMNVHLNGGKSEELWPNLAKQGNQSITIAHVDAPQSFELKEKHAIEMSDDCYRIGYWAWELPEFPDSWIQYASVFDEIWCPSEFCREAMALKLPKPVHSMPHSILPPEVEGSISEWRVRFNLPEHAFLFLFSFDFNSYAPRKNPEAVIDAYRIACKEMKSPVGLVLKMHGAGYDRGERQKLEKLKEELPGLYIVDESLSREELTGLQYACDAFVSLHRSEGFGLAVAEMMALGKPVISTNWSATAEFVSSETGCPVDFDLVELDQNVGPYTKGQYWADPKVEDAARWMTLLVEEPQRAKDLGLAAQKHIQTNYSPASIGKLYLSRIKSIALF